MRQRGLWASLALALALLAGAASAQQPDDEHQHPGGMPPGAAAPGPGMRGGGMGGAGGMPMRGMMRMMIGADGMPDMRTMAAMAGHVADARRPVAGRSPRQPGEPEPEPRRPIIRVDACEFLSELIA